MRIFTFLSLALLPLLASAQTGSWAPLNSPTTRHLRDVHFVDRDLGWIVGDSAIILHTTDGGATWISQTAPGPFHLRSVAFMNADTGYAVREYGGLIRTFDGGNTWAADTLLMPIGCFGNRVRIHGQRVYFMSEGCFGGTDISTYDFATGDTSTFFNYLTGAGMDFYPQFNDVGFPGGQDALVIGDDDLHARSTNLGETWTLTPITDTLPDWSAVHFDPAGIGHAITTDIFNPLYRSSDGGQTWVLDSVWLSTFFYPTATDVDFPSTAHGVVTGTVQWDSTGLIFESGLQGNPFQYFGLPHRAFAVDMVDDSVGFVVGEHGMIWKRVGGPLATPEPASPVGLRVYPNPSEGNVQLQWDGGHDARVQLVGPDGRVLRRFVVRPGLQSIDLGALAAGCYLLRLPGGVSAKLLLR